MKKINAYICSKCGAVYIDKKDAAKCERWHFAKYEVIDYSYQPNADIPDLMTIKMTDRNGREYCISYVVNGTRERYDSYKKREINQKRRAITDK